jgi:hypothetical protein
MASLTHAATGRLDATTTDTVVNCSLVVLILTVIPWRHVWRTYVTQAGDRWRRAA